MTGPQKRSWAEEYDEKKRNGAKVRRAGGMEFIQDDNGSWFQRDGNACPGKGYDAQAIGDNPNYDRPPVVATRGLKGKRTRTPWPWERA